ncbi:MAG: hypothetical protein ABI282_11870 [Candidatus Baltobacteraceae bacterium]
MDASRSQPESFHFAAVALSGGRVGQGVAVTAIASGADAAVAVCLGALVALQAAAMTTAATPAARIANRTIGAHGKRAKSRMILRQPDDVM